MNQTTRICCMCEKWGTGGIESFLLNVFEHMDRTGMEIDLIAMKTESDFYLPRLEALGIPFRELSGSVRTLRRNHSRFRAVLRKGKYDVVHLNIYHALSLLYALDAMRAGVPVRIAHSHSNGLRKSPLRFLKMTLHGISKHLLCACATLRFACSDETGAFMFPRGAGYELIQNGIDLDQFAFSSHRREANRAHLRCGGELLICEVGRLCGQKNQSFLLEVFLELLKTRVDARLLLVGDGESEAQLREKAAALGISDRVIFYGLSEDIAGLLNAADVSVLPSLFEGFGIVAIEAQASGLPTLCSDRVPAQAVPTPLAQRLPLEAGAKVWAEKLLELAEFDRSDVRQLLASAGYEISAVAKKIEKAYRGEETSWTS